jgi:hypothetical protein
VLARKQFPGIINDAHISYEQEVYNLRLLNQLKHPNIPELLTFYTYQRRRHFLFPFAEGETLEVYSRKDAALPSLMKISSFIEHSAVYRRQSKKFTTI